MALRSRGIPAITVVYDVYSINQRSDFDVVPGDWVSASRRWRFIRRMAFGLVGDFVVFGWLLTRADVFQSYFDGGFLGGSLLRFREVDLLHLAGKNLVVMPYGGDVAVPSIMRSLAWRQGLMAHYPDLGRHESDTQHRIAHLAKRADFVVACLVHFETLPRWDLLTTLYYPIDTDEWRPTGRYSMADGRSGSVAIVHAPNHRQLKGTANLIQACQQLEAEGLRVNLQLLEHVPNWEVRRAMADADIVADQFILGFAMTALEGMSVGRPVLSNLSEPGYYEAFRALTGLDNCPIVNTPPDLLVANLRRLIEDPLLRRQLGEAGRLYVLNYHALDPVGRMWDAVYRQVWFRRPMGVAAWDPASPADPE